MSFLVLDKTKWLNKNGQMFTITDKIIIYDIYGQTDKLPDREMLGDIGSCSDKIVVRHIDRQNTNLLFNDVDTDKIGD